MNEDVYHFAFSFHTIHTASPFLVVEHPFFLPYHLEHRDDHGDDQKQDNDSCALAHVLVDERVFVEQVYQGLGLFQSRVGFIHYHVH